MNRYFNLYQNIFWHRYLYLYLRTKCLYLCHLCMSVMRLCTVMVLTLWTVSLGSKQKTKQLNPCPWIWPCTCSWVMFLNNAFIPSQIVQDCISMFNKHLSGRHSRLTQSLGQWPGFIKNICHGFIAYFYFLFNSSLYQKKCSLPLTKSLNPQNNGHRLFHLQCYSLTDWWWAYEQSPTWMNGEYALKTDLPWLYYLY